MAFDGASTTLLQAQGCGSATDRPRASALRPSVRAGPAADRTGACCLTDDVLFGDVWIRPELSPRDRSLVTISVLIATGKPAQLEGHLGRALNNGVLPTEASGVLAHLAIYSGWPNAVSALDVYDRVYAARKVDMASLAGVVPPVACSCLQTPPVRARSTNSLRPSRQSSRNSPTTSSLGSSGGGLISLCETAASSPSPPWLGWVTMISSISIFAVA